MTMPVRWSLVVLVLLFIISLLTLSRISSSFNSSPTSFRQKRKSTLPTSLLVHRLQEEQHLRSRNAQILQDLEENDYQLELDCSSPPSTSSLDTSASMLSRDELSLQKADFERELALELQRQYQNYDYDGTLLNESPSALKRHLERKLRHQRRLMSAYLASRQQRAALSYSSQECIAWRARQQRQQQQHQRQFQKIQRSGRRTQSSSSSSESTDTLTAVAAITRFQQFHPNRRDLEFDSIFGQTLSALGRKKYTDPKGFLVELDPIKVMAGSRRATTYQNDDIHVLVLDMQWDPEVTVVVGNVLDETVKLRQEGYRPVMLNVGDSDVPGGDYHLDSTTNNEADLFRRTTLHQCLDQEPRRSRFYPLSNSGGIYCPNQAVFRHGQDRGNEFMDRFEWISVVSVAPIPSLETREKEGGLGGVQFLEGEDDLLRRRILAAMKVGVSQGHDALVLPPHGTDAGQNPSEAIAAIYRSIIGRDFMGGRKRFQTYKKIVMVLDPEQAYKVVNETSSYRPTQPPAPITTPLPSSDNDESSEEADKNEDEEQEDESDQDDDKQPLANGDISEDDDDNTALEMSERSDPEDHSDDEDEDNDSNEQDQSDEDEENDSDEQDQPDEDEENDSDEQDQSDEDEDNDADEQDQSDEEEDNDADEQDQSDEEDEELVGEEINNDDEALEDQLAVEDEVSESEALMEEQLLERDVDMSDEAMDEDLNDVLGVDGEESSEEEDSDIDSRQGASTDTAAMEESLMEESHEDQDDEEDEVDEGHEGEAEEFVPIIETVYDVFLRMLEQRSLLIVKNRARGILETEDADNGNKTAVAAVAALASASASASAATPTATNSDSSAATPTPSNTSSA